MFILLHKVELLEDLNGREYFLVQIFLFPLQGPGDMFGVLWCITTGKSAASFNLSTKLTRRAPNPPHLHCIACTFAQFRRIYNKGMTECSIQQGDMIYSRVIQYKVYILSNKIKFQEYFLRNSASSFHWLSSSIFTVR